MRFSRLLFIAGVFSLIGAGVTRADPIEIVTNATWLTTATAPADGWNSDVNFDTAGWVDAFKSPSGNNIWIDSNRSGQAPNQAWFRQTFTLSAPVTSAVVDVFFDDHGEAYLNGHVLEDYPSGGSKDFPNITVDPSWFNVGGENLLAIHGVDAEGPFNNVAMNLVVNTVPEPATGIILPLGAVLLLRQRDRAGRRVRV